jgi:hypothetical protein
MDERNPRGDSDDLNRGSDVDRTNEEDLVNSSSDADDFEDVDEMDEGDEDEGVEDIEE